MSEFKTEDDPHGKAASLGLDVYEPKAHEVLLDFDEPTPDDEEHYDSVLNLLNDAMSNETSPFVPFLKEVKRTVSQSGRGAHVYLSASRDLTDLERTLIQAVLGSDRKREALGFIRIALGSKRPPGLLFEVPESKPRIRICSRGAFGINCGSCQAERAGKP